MADTATQTLKIMNNAKWYNNWLMSYIRKYLSGSILEVGAGTGNFSKKLRKFGSLTAIDINPEYIRNLNNRKITAGLGDIETGKYFFSRKTFNSIIALNVLEHIENDNQALKNIYKLLNKNSYLILLVPAHQELYSTFDKEIGHFRRYSLTTLSEKLIKAGFKIEMIRYLNWWAYFGWLLFLRFPRKKKMPKPAVSIFDALGRIFLYPEKFIRLPFGLSVLAVARKSLT